MNACSSACGYCGRCSGDERGHGAERTCSHCGEPFWMPASEPYVLSPLCDDCDNYEPPDRGDDDGPLTLSQQCADAMRFKR